MGDAMAKNLTSRSAKLLCCLALAAGCLCPGCDWIGSIVPLADLAGASPSTIRTAHDSAGKTLLAEPVLPENLNSQDPRAVAAAFLEAIKSGREATALAMLTRLAQDQVGTMGLDVVTPGSPYSFYHVGSPQFHRDAPENVHVPCVWSNGVASPNGRQAADLVLVLRREDQAGWRVAGVVQLFEGGREVTSFESSDRLLSLAPQQTGSPTP